MPGTRTGFSPKYLRLSLAAAMSLELRPGLFYRGALLRCLNLLLTYPDGCRASCAYCGLARPAGVSENSSKGSDSGQETFIRVEWPTFSLEEILVRTKENCDLWERICVSMVMHPRAVDDTVRLLREIGSLIDLPLSVLANPSSMRPGQMRQLREAGAEMAAVAIDGATEEVFDRCRGRGVGGPHSWGKYWRSLEEAAITFGPDRAGCHLIAGLGETEAQMVAAIQRVRDLGARTHLFSFYPEQGSRLEGADPCPASHFRRIQLARFLIDYDLARESAMEFDEHGRITGFGAEGAFVDDLVAAGEPFMTSGCPGATSKCACNRPYGDGPPSDIRSFPFRPEAADIRQIRKELATYAGDGTGLCQKA